MTKALRITGSLLIAAALVWIGISAVERYRPHALPRPPGAKDSDGPQGWLIGGLGPATLQEHIARYAFIENLAWSCGGILVGGILLAVSFRRHNRP